MERKKSTILLLCVVIGAFGLTFGYFYMTQPEPLNPLFLLLYKPSPSAPNIWTWVSGNYSLNNLGNYGKKGVAAAINVPGARHQSADWIDSNGNLWLFGGYGNDNETGPGRLNDLWKFNIKSGLWTWVSGNYSINNLGNYGKKGVAAASNVPGGRNVQR